MSIFRLCAKCWFITGCLFGLAVVGVLIYNGEVGSIPISLLSIPVSLMGSLPAWLVLAPAIIFLRKITAKPANKWSLFLGLVAVLCLAYGIAFALLDSGMRQGIFNGAFIQKILMAAGLLFAGNAMSIAICSHHFNAMFNANYASERPHSTQSFYSFSTLFQNFFIHKNSNKKTMNSEANLTQQEPEYLPVQKSDNFWNNPVVKAVITGVLILLMLIPTAYITDLVNERKDRQQEVTNEVSAKWGNPQTITTPYLYIPYNVQSVDEKGKVLITRNYLLAIAENLDVKSDIETTLRARSIYQVLLYNTQVKMKGDFKFKLPKDIEPANLLLKEARLCVGISDFKGIEEKLNLQWGDSVLDMEPGLPYTASKATGLSVNVNLEEGALNKTLPFSLGLKLKGTEKLHFVPLSNNSQFTFNADWPSPSFDGHSLPREHAISDSGFTAKWSFNQANLPFSPVLKNEAIQGAEIAFGVSLLQPGHHYSKTLRSVKYALLFIGLTFALFFIIEVSQNKMVHPVQYVLIGLALVIFYTLLLSISEFIGFNYAYLIASLATSLLIGFYGKSLFASLKTSLLLGSFIAFLYGFIYTLIQLEDTALLAGSIGLFLLLGAAMYFSRSIKWSGNNGVNQIIPQPQQ